MTEHGYNLDSSADDDAALVVRTPTPSHFLNSVRLKTVTIHDLSPSVGVISPSIKHADSNLWMKVAAGLV